MGYRIKCSICKEYVYKKRYSSNKNFICDKCRKGNINKMNKSKNLDKVNREKRLKELKEKVKKLKKDTFSKLYSYTLEYYNLKIIDYPEYTYRQLSIDLDITETTIYRLMCYRYATEYTQEQIKNEKISPSKVLRILAHKKGREKQNEVIKYVIDKKYTYREVEEHLFNLEKIKHGVIKKREFKRKDNLEREIKNYCLRVQKILPHLYKLQENKKDEIIKIMNETIQKMKKTIQNLK